MRITHVEPILLKGEGTYGHTASATEASDAGDWQMLVKVSTDEGLVGWSDVEIPDNEAVRVRREMERMGSAAAAKAA